MPRIGKKFLADIESGTEYSVRYRWGERFQGEIEWLDWDKGVLTYVAKANDRDEPGINILDEGGWGYAGREPELDDACAVPGKKSHVFGRYAEGPNQHLMQVQVLKKHS